MSKVDYSELVDALVEGDHEKANELVKEVLPRLEKYLRVGSRRHFSEGMCTTGLHRRL